MITKEIYDALEKRFGQTSSWGLYTKHSKGQDENGKDIRPTADTGDMSVFDIPDLPNHLTRMAVFVGLNLSVHNNRKDGYTGPWWNFHSDDDSKQKDFKLRYALKDTPYAGSYMTDVIKNHPNKSSSEVVAYIRKHPEVLTENINILREELSILGGNPVLIALGRDVERYLNEHLGNEYTIIYVTHYSDAISKENFSAELKEKLSPFIPSEDK